MAETTEPTPLVPNFYRLQGTPDVVLPLRFMDLDELRLAQEHAFDRTEAEMADLRMITHAIKACMKKEDL